MRVAGQQLGIGASLRRAREEAGIDLQQVEAQTRIPVRLLEALEAERFDRVPPGLYRRSFLREYAEFLGLDGDRLLGEYEARFAAPEPGPPPPPPRRRRAARPTPVALVLVLVAAGLAVAAWRLGTAPAPVTPSGARPAHARVAPPQPTTAAAPPAPAPAPAALRIAAARGDCWLLVQIGSPAGAVVYERTLHEGQVVRFGLARALWIRLGAPWNVEASIGPRTVTARLPAGPGDVVVDAGGIRPVS